MISHPTLQLLQHCHSRSLSLGEVVNILRRENVPENIDLEEIEELFITWDKEGK